MKKNHIWKATLRKFALCSFTALLLLFEVISGQIPPVPSDGNEPAVLLDDKKPDPTDNDTNLG